MINANGRKQLLAAFEKLPDQAQRQVAQFARSLATRGSASPAAEAILQLAGTLDPRDLQTMDDAIQEGCEKVDRDAW